MKKSLLAVFVTLTLLFTMGSVSIAQEYTLRIAYSTPEGGHYDILMRRFRDLVEERTGGDVRLILIPGGAAGSEKELVEQLMMGTLDMAITTIPGFVEERLDLLTVPFVFKDNDHVKRCSYGLVGQEMASWMAEKNVVIIDFYPRMLTATATKTPVRKYEDWAGLKIRVAELEPLIDFYRAFGASPTPLPFGEVYTGLETGIVDGVRTIYDLIYDTGFYEHTDYVVVTGDPTTPAFFQASKRSFERLPEEIQLIIYQTAAEMREFNEQWVEEQWDIYTQKFVENGLEVIIYDSEQAREAVKDLAYKYADRMDAHDLLELVRSLE